MQGSTAVILLNFSAKNPPHRQAETRWLQPYDCTIMKLSTKILLYLFTFVILIATRWNIVKLDGIGGEVCGLFLHTDTKYSKNYSHRKFDKIKIGMTQNEVISILGEPLVRWNPYIRDNSSVKKLHCAFEYSISPSDTHYRLRSVRFFNGKVKEVQNCFYWD